MEPTYIVIFGLILFIVFYLYTSFGRTPKPSKPPSPRVKTPIKKRSKKDNDALTRRIIRRFKDDA